MTVSSPGRIEGRLTSALRYEVLREIERQGLDAETLARRLDLVPTAVRAVLRRPEWSLKTALIMADGLELPLDVSVNLAETA